MKKVIAISLVALSILVISGCSSPQILAPGSEQTSQQFQES